MKRIILLPLVLSACVTTPPPAADGIIRARIGQTVSVDGPRITPLELLEDSRCPINARCVWAGQVRLRAKITLGSGSREIELTSNRPAAVADGQLELVEITPQRMAGGEQPTRPDYRFGFTFAGGL